jgi:hypothetical protein
LQFEYAILLGVGVAAAAGLGALLVPQVRQAMPRAEPALPQVAPLRIDKSLFAAILLLLMLIRLFCQPTQKEMPTVHPPDGPLERLHSPEQRPFSAFCHPNPFPPMLSILGGRFP